jgi:hypothetical protein
MTVLLLIACTSPPRQAGTPTPTAAPVVIATAEPTVPATPTRPDATPIAQPTLPAATSQQQSQAVYVTNTGGQGLTLRQAPGGAAIRGLPDGTALTPTGEEQIVGDRLWRKVRDAQGREGWVAADFLTAEAPDGPPSSPAAVTAGSPVPEPSRVAPEPPTPTWPVPLIPTATLRPPVPTRTPRPAESPAPIVAPTAPPLIVPGIVATKPASGPGSRP